MTHPPVESSPGQTADIVRKAYEDLRYLVMERCVPGPRRDAALQELTLSCLDALIALPRPTLEDEA